MMEGIFSVLLAVLPPIFMIIGVLHDYKKMNREWSDLLKRQTEDWKEHCKYINKNWSDLCKQLDAGEVKHGHNATSMHTVDEFLCSVCGFCCADYTETKYDEDGDYTYSCECEFDYCPKCGAKMDGDSHE